MTDRLTATSMRPEKESGLSQIVEAKLPNGTAIEVIIPPPICVTITNAVQKVLMHSMELTQKMGGLALLPVTKLVLGGQENSRTLLLQTEVLGVIGIQLTQTQWQEVAKMAHEAQSGSKRIH